jgi:hypothetical protein
LEWNHKEMLMRKDLRRKPVQLGLFHRRSVLPRWWTLPLEVRQQAHALVVQLLKERRLGRRVNQAGKGVSDE